MVYTPLEVIALVLIGISLLKLFVVLTNKMSWFNGVVKPIYSNGKTTQIIGIILAAIVFYYISLEMTITQIFGAFTLLTLLMVFSFADSSKETLEFAKKLYSKRISASQWLLILIWVALVILTLAEIFA